MVENSECASWLVKHKFELVLCSAQVLIIILMGCCTEYEYIYPDFGDMPGEADFTSIYNLFQHISIMIFIGFGFLMVFLKTHSWSSVGFNYLAAFYAIELYIIFSGFWRGIIDDEFNKVKVNIDLLINAEFCAAAVLISLGGVLGKVSPLKLIVMTFAETFLYAMNERILTSKLYVVDIGGSIIIHTFGAYFGLMVSWMISPSISKDHPNNASNYNSNTLAFIGTIFLWIYWPSFNGIYASGNSRQCAFIGTILSLCGSCMSTFIFSGFFQNGKLNMEHILNATLSGGVVVGASVFIMKDPYIPLIIGFLTGIISTWGFENLSPYLQKKIGLHDTCGIHNLHGMPGVLGGFVSMIVIASADDIDDYIEHEPQVQALYQLASLLTALGIALVSGFFVGYILRKDIFEPPRDLFNDKLFWTGDFDNTDYLEYAELKSRSLND